MIQLERVKVCYNRCDWEKFVDENTCDLVMEILFDNSGRTLYWFEHRGEINDTT